MLDTISISTVVYNNYSDALALIESIETYTNPSIRKKLFVIDNSVYKKKDNAQPAFLKALHTYDDIEYIRTPSNLGFGVGHNHILSMIDSEYHAIVNPDILLQEDALGEIISYMNHREDVGMCIPRIISLDGNIQKAYRRELTVLDIFIRTFMKIGCQKRKQYHTMQDMDYTKEFQVPFGHGSFFVIRTKLILALGGFDERYFLYVEDADLCRRVNAVSRLVYFPGAKVIHRWKRESHFSVKLYITHIKSIIAYFHKWGIKWS